MIGIGLSSTKKSVELKRCRLALFCFLAISKYGRGHSRSMVIRASSSPISMPISVEPCRKSLSTPGWSVVMIPRVSDNAKRRTYPTMVASEIRYHKGASVRMEAASLVKCLMVVRAQRPGPNAPSPRLEVDTLALMVCTALALVK
jgi:hypothetical protein